jgi:DNA-binding XRE family transcriptional regulator
MGLAIEELTLLGLYTCQNPYCDSKAADAKAAYCKTASMPPISPPPPTSALSARGLLAKNMIQLRQARQWSQERLALEAGLHRTFVAHVERHARNISLDNLEKIATALGVEIHSLLLP